MKFSQVQDVEYLLNKNLNINLKLVVKFNDDIVIGKFIKENQTEDFTFNRFGDLNARFKHFIQDFEFTNHRKPEWFVNKDEYKFLNELIKFTNKINEKTTEFSVYNANFLNSNKEISLLLVNPETDFEIIGLSD